MSLLSGPAFTDGANNIYGWMKAVWVPFDRRRKLGSKAKKIEKMHPEWVPLTDKEKKLAVYKEDYSQMTAFKNTYCEGKELPYGFITDIAYQNIILPGFLHRTNYKFGRVISNDIFHDKNYFSILMPEVTFPKTVLRNVDGEFLTEDHKICENPLEILDDHDELVFKGSIDSGSGRGIRLVNKEDYQKRLISYKENFIVQEHIKESDYFSHWNPSSVNIVRVTTCLWKGEVHNLGAILKVGAPGGFCDQTSSEDGQHARFAGINEDGTLMDKAYDHDTLEVLDNIWGNTLGGKVEGFEEMVSIALREQERFPHHKIIGWDFTVDRSGKVICIEYNGRVPGMNLVQYALGPVLAKKTMRGTSILEEMLHK